jgi:hypothetical protein
LRPPASASSASARQQEEQEEQEKEDWEMSGDTIWPSTRGSASCRSWRLRAACFRCFIGRAMRQHPDTVVAGFKYEPSALLDSFLLSQYPRRFTSREVMRMMEMSAEEQEAQMALMDACAPLAETFEVLLRD